MTRLIESSSNLDHTVAPLDGAEVVVGIGMGVGGPEGVEVVKDFARTHRGRPLCDAARHR